MAEMKIKTPADEVILLPRKILPRLSAASADELRILVAVFAEPGSTLADVARSTGVPVANAEAAFSFWRGAGVFEETAIIKNKPVSDTSSYRNYDSGTLSEAKANDNDFGMVCEIAAERLGKILTKNELSALYYLYDFARIPAAVICGIVGYCCEKGKKSMQYIYKTAIGLYEEENIDTVDKLESYISRRELVETDIGRIKTVMGFGDREPSANEKKIFERWFDEWKLKYDIVRLAYDKTADNTGKASIRYMDGILRRWHESGFETPEDVETGEASRKEGTQTSFDTDGFIEAALNRKFDD